MTDPKNIVNQIGEDVMSRLDKARKAYEKKKMINKSKKLMNKNRSKPSHGMMLQEGGILEISYMGRVTEL